LRSRTAMYKPLGSQKLITGLLFAESSVLPSAQAKYAAPNNTPFCHRESRIRPNPIPDGGPAPFPKYPANSRDMAFSYHFFARTTAKSARQKVSEAHLISWTLVNATGDQTSICRGECLMTKS